MQVLTRAATRLAAIGAMLAGTVYNAPAADLPYGHKDFYPSPQRPLGWRGDGTGCYPGAAGVPLDWDLATGSNLLWKTSLGYSLSTPIAFGGKVFTAEEPDGLVCLDAATGKQLWKQNMGADPVAIKELKTSGTYWKVYRFSMPTPVSDGRHVVVRSGAGKLGCFDLEGKRLWIADLEFKNGGDSISSPLLVDGRVILNDGALKAFNVKDGRLLWKADWPICNSGYGDWASGTPAVMRHASGAIVVGVAGAVVNAADGAILTPGCKTKEVFSKKENKLVPTFEMDLINSTEAQSPVVVGDRLYGMHHRRIDPNFVAGRVVADEKGWRLEKVWKTNNGAAHRTHASPLIVDGFLYSANHQGNLTKINLADGKLVTNQPIFHAQASWGADTPEKARKGNIQTGLTWGETWCASYAMGRLYFGTNQGYLGIVDPQRLDQATVRWFGSTCIAAGPVFAGDRMYVRTDNALFCIAPKARPETNGAP